MTDDLTQLDGVGEAREETLVELGYETFEALAEADHEELADEVNRMNEDTALSLVVQSQNMADLEEAEVEESDEGEGESDEGEGESEEGEPEPPKEAEDAEADTESQSASETGPETYTVSFKLESGPEYETFFHAAFEQRANLYRTNRAGKEMYDKIIEQLVQTQPGSTVEIELEKDELNNLHNAVLEQRIEYQGNNLIDYMDALASVENKINTIREDNIF